MKAVAIDIEKVRAGVQTPIYQTACASGLDVCAAIDAPLILAPMQRRLIPTGLKLAIPHGFEIQVRPRSGLALKHGITVLNAPGTIDADYRGEVQVLLINLGSEPFTIAPGDRIAQLVCGEVTRVTFVERERLDATVRGEGGFGHTGTKP